MVQKVTLTKHTQESNLPHLPWANTGCPPLHKSNQPGPARTDELNEHMFDPTDCGFSSTTTDGFLPYILARVFTRAVGFHLRCLRMSFNR